MITDLIKNNIKNNLVYHGSPYKLDILQGDKTGKYSNEKGSIFVTPCKGIASCFIINKNDIFKELYNQFNEYIFNFNINYNVWNKKIDELYDVQNNIDIIIDVDNVKKFSGISIGYIYFIDFNKYKNKCHMFNKNLQSDVEFLIEGNIEYIKKEKHIVKWNCFNKNEYENMSKM